MSNNQRRNGPKFNPGMHGMRGGGEKAKDFKGTIAKLFRYLKPYYFKLVVVIILQLLQQYFQLLDQRF